VQECLLRVASEPPRARGYYSCQLLRLHSVDNRLQSMKI